MPSPAPDRPPPGRRAVGLPPTAGAAVMSTGILSTATSAAGLRWLSLVLLGLAALGEVVLGAALLVRLLADRPGFLRDAGTPAALTGVAATAVLGGRVAALGLAPVARVLLAGSALLWLVLLPVVLRHWRVPTVGASFLACVATEGLAVLAGVLGRGDRVLVAAGLAAFLLGLVLYVVVLARFDWHQLAAGGGDQWVLAGALAITSLAGAELLSAGVAGLRAVDLAVWALAVAGYALLVACEVRRPRPRYDIRRWATVFPMGMTAAASFAVARACALPGLRAAGHVLLWPALAAWCLTAVGAVRHR